jgi:hypothetical protein
MRMVWMSLPEATGKTEHVEEAPAIRTHPGLTISEVREAFAHDSECGGYLPYVTGQVLCR